MYVCVYYVCMYICVYYICMYDVTLRRVQETIAAVLKAINITYLCARARVGRCVVCVCGGGGARMCAVARISLLIQHATRMRHIVISASLAPPYFLKS